MHVRIGATVFGADRARLGQVARVVIDPRIEELTDLLVQPSEDSTVGIIVPLSLVTDSDEDSVHLSIRDSEYDRLPQTPTVAYVPLESIERGPLVGWQGPPDYSERQILIPAEILYDVPVRPFAPHIVQEGGLLNDQRSDIAEATEVACQDEVVGHVVEALVDPGSGDLRGIAVKPGDSEQPARVVPATLIAEITPARIRLRCDRAEFDRFPVHGETSR